MQYLTYWQWAWRYRRLGKFTKIFVGSIVGEIFRKGKWIRKIQCRWRKIQTNDDGQVQHEFERYFWCALVSKCFDFVASTVGDKVSQFLWMFLNYTHNTNHLDHYTLSMFYATYQVQIFTGCGYHVITNMFSLTKFAGECIPLKCKKIGFTFQTVKNYASNNVEGHNICFLTRYFGIAMLTGFD